MERPRCRPGWLGRACRGRLGCGERSAATGAVRGGNEGMRPKSSKATHVGDLTFLGFFFVEMEDFCRDDRCGLFFSLLVVVDR